MTSISSVTKGERTRQALVDTAIRRFAVSGYKGVSLADVAREVGVSPAAVYAYFPGKEALFTAAVDSDAAGLIERALYVVLAGHFQGDWSRLIQLLLDGLPHHPLARRVLAGLEPESTERLLGIPALAQLRRELARLLADEQGAGRVRPDIDPEQIADGLETMVLALLIGILQTGGSPPPERVGGIMAVFDAALHAPVPPVG